MITAQFTEGQTDYVAMLNALVSQLNAEMSGSFSAGPGATNGLTLTYSVGSNALTIAVKTMTGVDASSGDPLFAIMRSATASAGSFAMRTITTALSLVVSSGSKLGHANSDSRWTYVYLIDYNAGTLELAVSSRFYGLQGITSTTAEGGAGAADSATAMYSTTARSSVPYLCVGRFTAPQTTAGTWATAVASAEAWPFESDQVSGETLRYNADFSLLAGTLDGADNLTLVLAAGGAATTGRGPFIKMYGNEVATLGGDLQIASGLGAGSIYIDYSEASVAITSAGKLSLAGQVLINTVTSNAGNQQGLTIDQVNSDDEILSFKSTGDVAHGVTTVAETQVFARFLKAQSANGGLQVDGISSGAQPFILRAITGSATTGKTGASPGAFQFNGALISGTGITNLGANVNIAVFQSNGTTRFILDADGDSHQDVGTAWTNFDTHDDIVLLNALAGELTPWDDPLKAGFYDYLGRHRETLTDNRIVTFNDDGHHFINWSRTNMVVIGGMRQLGARAERNEGDLRAMAAELSAVKQTLQRLEARA